MGKIKEVVILHKPMVIIKAILVSYDNNNNPYKEQAEKILSESDPKIVSEIREKLFRKGFLLKGFTAGSKVTLSSAGKDMLNGTIPE